MLWRNGEHYPDPTAGAAFQRIAREEARNEMNEGKRFERDFKASVPPDAWCYRLRDSPVSYYGGSGAEGIRFAQDNICWTCSECGYTVDTDDPDDLTKFCPNCGAKMEGGHNP